MRHLLVVDDEPNLVDGLCHVLAEALGDDIVISKAYSGAEALSILYETPVDILITDVRMPDISGLDLLQDIHKLRMNCRVLILTGYDEFNAIHEAVKLPQTAGFLLKNEGDEEIIKAVKKSLSSIDEVEKNHLALVLAERQSKTLDILLRERRLWHLLGTLPYYDESVASIETPLTIDVKAPSLLIVVRSLSAYISASTIIWLEQQVQQIFSKHFLMEICIFGPTDMAWLLQECKDTPFQLHDDVQRAGVLKSGLLEIQSRLANNGIDISISLTSKWVQTHDLPGYVHALRNILYNLHMGSQHLQIIDISMDEHGQFDDVLKNADSTVSGNRCVHMAKNALYEGNAEAWEAAIFMASALSETDPAVIVQFLNILISTNDTLRFPPFENMPKLLSPDNNYALLRAAGSAICQKRKQTSKHIISDIITRVHNFIEKNLDSPTLSVASIATEIHYNPSYLSRLYKQQTGVSITETIDDIRINKACEMLKKTSARISEVSRRVGYASPSSFTFFFRKRLGMTPREFRNDNM